MTSSDKDFRFMATNDLMTELQKDSIKVSFIMDTHVVIIIPRGESVLAPIFLLTKYLYNYMTG